MALVFPLVAWGAPDDISASPWASQGTPVVTAGQTDPFGGTDAVLIEDDNAGGYETRYRSVPFSATSAVIGLAAKAGTAGISDALVSDSTRVTTRSLLRFTWSGGVPIVTVASGIGSVLGTIAMGGGWYLALWSIPSSLTNTDTISLSGTRALAADTGSTYWYLRNLVLLDLVSDDRSWDEPREGSEQVRAPSGLYDRWIVGGRDYRFEGKVQWIPTTARSNPVIVSGWDGANEAVGVNCGLRAMLKAGQEGDDLIWVPDRSNCADNIPSELLKPWIGDKPDIDGVGGHRSFMIELSNRLRSYPTVV